MNHPWPFPAGPAHYTPRPRDTDFDLREEEEAPESPFCKCDLQPMPSELDSGECSSCGKALP